MNAEKIDLATITFLAMPAALGTQNVEFDDSTDPLIFTDKDGNNGAAVTPAIVGTHPLSFNVTQSPTVYVDVALQGRSNYTGLQLEVKPTDTGNVLYDTDDTDSSLQIINVPAKVYAVRLDAPKYLAAVRSIDD